MALEDDLNTFRRELPRLLEQPENRGKYALIHGAKVVEEVFPTLDAALAVGYERFGLEPFLVQEITDEERPLYFSRNVSPCRW